MDYINFLKRLKWSYNKPRRIYMSTNNDDVKEKRKYYVERIIPLIS